MKCQFLSKGDLLYFDRYHRHQCLYPNSKLSSQYFCDNMNDCETKIILCSWKDCLWSCFLPKHGNCLLSVSAAARFECSWMIFQRFNTQVNCCHLKMGLHGCLNRDHDVLTINRAALTHTHTHTHTQSSSSRMDSGPERLRLLEASQLSKNSAVLLICLPEEGVVLNADFPNSFGGPVVGQLEADGALELLGLTHTYKSSVLLTQWSPSPSDTCFAQSYLSWPDLDVEVTAFVGDLEDFGPSKAVYPQTILID